MCKEKFAEVEEVQGTEEKAAQVVKDEVQAAGKKAAEDKEGHKERQKNSDAELVRFRRTNGTPVSDNAALKAEHGSLKVANDAGYDDARRPRGRPPRFRCLRPRCRDRAR